MIKYDLTIFSIKHDLAIFFEKERLIFFLSKKIRLSLFEDEELLKSFYEMMVSLAVMKYQSPLLFSLIVWP